MKKIYIGNLSFSTTEERLSSIFGEYGEVASATIIKDKFTEMSKGFGFVEMPDDVSATSAISSLNGKEIDGRKIRVNEAVDKKRPPRFRNEESNEYDDNFAGRTSRSFQNRRSPRKNDNEY